MTHETNAAHQPRKVLLHPALKWLLRCLALLLSFPTFGLFAMATQELHNRQQAYVSSGLIAATLLWIIKTLWATSRKTPAPWKPFHHVTNTTTPPGPYAYAVAILSIPIPHLLYYTLTSWNSHHAYAVGVLITLAMMTAYDILIIREYRYRDRTYSPHDPKLRKDVIGPYWWISVENRGVGWPAAYIAGTLCLGLSTVGLNRGWQDPSSASPAAMSVAGWIGVIGALILRMGIVRRKWEKTHELTAENTRSSLYDRYRTK